MKWLQVYGLPRLPLFLARLAMRLGLPGPTWYKWKAASAGTGVILDEMIRAADDLGYDGQKVGKLAMTRIGQKQGSDLREQLNVTTMKDAVDVVMLANRFFDIEITLTETKEGEYVINADRCPWFGGMGHDGVPGWDVKPCAAFSTYEKAMVEAINPNVKLSYTEKRTTGGHTCRGVYQYRDEALGDGPPAGVTPEMVSIGKKPKK
ncbi:MAG: L-2-amino-thiazoline-4-carboxylic acid hydrolase [Actinomycetota bacterium]|nr:L-2-amino-thiazoline-4-carboxylic acid hydrolase [Actinomycetota bacterium]